MKDNMQKEAVKLARKAGAPEGWVPWIFTAALNGIICEGAVCPLVTRGKNKGEPNYRKADKNTKGSVLITKRMRHRG